MLQEMQDAQMQDMDIMGAIKIKDGIFIGDEFASKDLEFIVTNKVTKTINCAGRELGNLWENIGVQYLTFPWLEADEQVLFDAQNKVLNEIFQFIEQAMDKGESVLVHSVRGQSRSCCVLAAYFMRKYKWSLYKTLEFLNQRRPDLEIRASFFQQLNELEQKLIQFFRGAISTNWNEIGENPKNLSSEELLIRNTFLNSQEAQARLLNKKTMKKARNPRKRVGFCEQKNVYVEPDQQLTPSQTKTKNRQVSSILKGSRKQFNLDKENTQKNSQKMERKTRQMALRSSQNKKKKQVTTQERPIRNTLQEKLDKYMKINKSRTQKFLEELLKSDAEIHQTKKDKEGLGEEKFMRTHDGSEKKRSPKKKQSQLQIPRASSLKNFEREKQIKKRNRNRMLHEKKPLRNLLGQQPQIKSRKPKINNYLGSSTNKHRNSKRAKEDKPNKILHNLSSLVSRRLLNSTNKKQKKKKQKKLKRKQFHHRDYSLKLAKKEGGSLLKDSPQKTNHSLQIEKDQSKEHLQVYNKLDNSPQLLKCFQDKESLSYLASKQLREALKKKKQIHGKSPGPFKQDTPSKRARKSPQNGKNALRPSSVSPSLVKKRRQIQKMRAEIKDKTNEYLKSLGKSFQKENSYQINKMSSKWLSGRTSKPSKTRQNQRREKLDASALVTSFKLRRQERKRKKEKYEKKGKRAQRKKLQEALGKNAPVRATQHILQKLQGNVQKERSRRDRVGYLNKKSSMRSKLNRSATPSVNDKKENHVPYQKKKRFRSTSPREKTRQAKARRLFDRSQLFSKKPKWRF